MAKAGETDALALAVSLEQATNGTSLVLLLRFGETTMLFPGDAQWGTWDRILHDPESEELLRTVNLYKVGHHGSHNATPVSFVSKYLNDADASIVLRGADRDRELGRDPTDPAPGGAWQEERDGPQLRRPPRGGPRRGSAPGRQERHRGRGRPMDGASPSRRQVAKGTRRSR